VGDTVENPEDQQDGPFLIDRFRSALSSFYLIRPFFVSSGIYLSSLRRNTSISLFSDKAGDIPPSLLFIFQLLIFLIPLDSSTCHSFFLISLEVSFTMLPHSDLIQKKRKCYSPLCPLLFTRLQSSSVGIT
jgi:hypothetical protein